MTAFLDLRRRTLLFVVSSITLLEDPDYLTQALSPEHCMFFMVTEIKHVYASCLIQHIAATSPEKYGFTSCRCRCKEVSQVSYE